MNFRGFLLILLISCVLTEKIVKRPKIVMLGDSITELALTMEGGSWRKIAAKYPGQADVVNRGLSGYNTHSTLSAVKMFIKNQDTFDPSQKTLVIIMLGSNDSAFPGYAQYVSLENYKKNLISIVNAIKAVGDDYKFLILPPVPVCDKQFDEIWTEHNRNNENTRQYYYAAKNVAEELKEQNVYFVDTWQNEKTEWAQNDYSMHTDGLHLTAKAYDVLVKYIMDVIYKNVPDFIPENIPGYPGWPDIDDNLKYLEN